MKPTFSIGVFGIITNNNKEVLLCHRRDYDLWNLPGGGMEHGESPWDTVVREIKEEIGVSATITQLLGIYSKPEKNEVVFMFECTIEGAPTLTDEADKIEYFPLETIPSNTSPKQVDRIKDYWKQKEENNTAPILKAQTGKSSIQMIKDGEL